MVLCTCIFKIQKSSCICKTLKIKSGNRKLHWLYDSVPAHMSTLHMLLDFCIWDSVIEVHCGQPALMDMPM